LSFNYIYFNSIPDKGILERVIKLHRKNFGDSKSLIKQMKYKSELLINLVMKDEKVIGYKICYELDDDKFYSWFGGVDGNSLKYGVTSKLTEEQSRYLKNNGFKIVQTKTKNKWRDMLILNIKSGFDVIGTYTDERGEPKIILEKKLLN